MNISFPSLSVMGKSAYQAFQRFPFVIVSSIIGALSVVWLINQNDASDLLEAKVFSLCFMGFLGISWMFSVRLFLEQLPISGTVSWVIRVAAFVSLVGYYFYLDTVLIDAKGEIWYQLVLFFLGSHLFAAFAPFGAKNNINQFWEYNKTLFLRFLISVVYSGALFVGLSVAMLALDNLLEINIKEEFYPSLFIIIGGIFNTWFFLSGLPSKDQIRQKNIEYPVGLKLFVQYVLIPLVSVYIVILYAYVVKIILQWELPNGWVANLVLSFSIVGILSLLLLYPIQNEEGKRWIQLFSKWYYRALIPLVILLFVSIWVRIAEYGVTINRFFVATLGVWLALIVGYYLFSKVKSIKVIPISLLAFVILSAVGPFSAMNVSERSQIQRLLTFTQSEEILKSDAELTALELSTDELLEITSMVDYLVENHGKEVFYPILSEGKKAMLLDSLDSKNRRDVSRFIVEQIIGVPWQDPYSNMNFDGSQNFAYTSSNQEAIEIADYDLFLGTYNFYTTHQSYDIDVGDLDLHFAFTNESLEFWFKSEGEELFVPIENTLQTLHQMNKGDWYSNNWKPSQMKITADGDQFEVLMLITYVTGKTGTTESVTNITVQLFAN